MAKSLSIAKKLITSRSLLSSLTRELFEWEINRAGITWMGYSFKESEGLASLFNII
jgi:hypothetical protein